ncbi:MAG: hypothetical protein ACQESC_03915, partial [Nanobdellota archaeon]
MSDFNRFWNEWTSINDIEKQAISGVERALKTIFEHVGEDKIHSIYIKGSFIRRDMDSKSDVDIVPIAFDNEGLAEVRSLQINNGKDYKPAELLPHSLVEFETGIRCLNYTSPKGGVDITLRELYRYELVYGTPLDVTAYPMRSDLEFLKGHLKAFHRMFLPGFENGTLKLRMLVKQTIFLVEKEQRVKGVEPLLDWSELATSIDDTNHILNDALA